MNEHHEVVAEHLGERFVDLGRLGLAAKRMTKLPLDHAKRRLDVAALVVVRNEIFTAIHEVAEHLAPRAAAARPAVPALAGVRALERDERRPGVAGDGVSVHHGPVSLVCRDFTDWEGPRRGVDQSGKLRAVVCVGAMNLDSRHHVSLDAAHEVHLDPCVLPTWRAVLVIEPHS